MGLYLHSDGLLDALMLLLPNVQLSYPNDRIRKMLIPVFDKGPNSRKAQQRRKMKKEVKKA